MIERHVTFTIHPGKEAEFESFIEKDYAPTLGRQPGCSRVKLLREIAAPRRYQISCWFEDEQAAAAWRASADHNALSPRLKTFFSNYELVFFAVKLSQE